MSAPVKIIDLRAHAVHVARFIAGMFGVIEDAAGALAPEFGWAVVYAPATWWDPDLTRCASPIR